MNKIHKYNDRIYWLEDKDKISTMILKSINENKVKNMFGEGIVKNAYQEIETYYANDLKKVTLEEFLEKVSSDKKNIIADFDITKGDVIIEFTNGRVVEIYTSEWGDITPIETGGKLVF